MQLERIMGDQFILVGGGFGLETHTRDGTKHTKWRSMVDLRVFYRHHNREFGGTNGLQNST